MIRIVLGTIEAAVITKILAAQLLSFSGQHLHQVRRIYFENPRHGKK
jgi:hypothetical protein